MKSPGKKSIPLDGNKVPCPIIPAAIRRVNPVEGLTSKTGVLVKRLVILGLVGAALNIRPVRGEENTPIQNAKLDDQVVYLIPVSTNRVTTISFPGPISAIEVSGVTVDGKTPGQFQLAHSKGSTFFSVRALARKVTTNVNIRWNKHTYVFEFAESDTPLLALNLEDQSSEEIVQPAPLLTHDRLLALLDKAKAFPLLKKQHPEAVTGAQARTFGDQPQISDFNDYEIRIEEVFRFNPEDTLVFHVTLRNKSDREIRYLPGSFCVQVGSRLYYQSISDAPGVLPPESASIVYFAVTGTPDGGRNELSLKNDFTILVTTIQSAPAFTHVQKGPSETNHIDPR